MAQAREYAEADQIQFALESLELDGDARLEVSGRWFGVRGRRFVRPTLTIIDDHQRRRCLADLEHKPWSAEDGEAWTAAFPVELDGQDVHELELAVAPDIAVALPPPGSAHGKDGDGKRSNNGLMAASPASGRRGLDPAARHRELEALRKRLDEQRKHVSELRAELDHAGVTKAEMTSALTRRDAAVRKFEAVVRERDEAVRERDHAVQERDEALRRRDQMTAPLDEALARAELASHEAGEARRERDGALRERESMVRALTRMRAERDDAVGRRKAALDRVEKVQSEATSRIAELRRQLERAQDVDAPAVAVAPPAPRPPVSRPTRRDAYVWARRAIALVVLIIAILAVILIIHSP